MSKTATIEVKDLITVPRGRKSRVQAALEALVQAAIDSGETYAALTDATDTLRAAVDRIREID